MGSSVIKNVVRSDTEGESGGIKRLPCDTVPLRELNFNWYLLVFVPLNNNYDKNFNALDFIRRNYTFGSCDYVITREELAEKVHWNLLVNSPLDMTVYHNRRIKRFFIHAQCVNYNTQNIVYRYMTKEYYESGVPWAYMVNFLWK